MRPFLGIFLAVTVGRVVGREIRIRGEKIKTLQGGEPYRDATACNSYVNGIPLQNCAYYSGTSTSPLYTGLPEACDEDPRGTGRCSQKATTAVCGTKRPDGTYAGANAPCSLNGECFGNTGCQEFLLKPRGGTVRVDGDVKKAYRYNIGTYFIKYGNAGDTCFWESRTCTERADGSFKVDCTPYLKDNSNLGVPGDPCVRVLKIVDTTAPQVQPTFNQNNMPETYSTLTDSSQCNPPTDAAKEDAACYDFFGLLGPYAPGYTVNPLDKWGGVEPEDKANCCGPNKDKPFYDVESEGRKRTVIHEAATQFQDPGVQIFDVVDGIMVYEENNFCKRIDNPKAGQYGEPECSVVGDPGKVCKVIAGGQKGKCTDALDLDYTRNGKQQILYYAMDSFDNLGFVVRTVEITGATTTTTSTSTSTTMTSTSATWLQVTDRCDPLNDSCDKAKNLVCSLEVYECQYGTTSTEESIEDSTITSTTANTTAPAEESLSVVGVPNYSVLGAMAFVIFISY